ncbi:lutropin subunit beta [Synchiropus splendidus]|uniref:lutropin subunit beta n=1 Tax=Synchiropus splendidus TaxID=270530 RepID=UPI00237D90E2|nr:lutropin subunit beta [Synchiropus splendidus]
MKVQTLLFTWLMGSAARLTPAEGFKLPPCQPITQTVSLEKEGCPKCHTVETTICSGHCATKDPIRRLDLTSMYQHVCTYQQVEYRSVRLPDCSPGVDPVVTYPVASSCHCGLCTLNTSDCTFESLQPDFCTNDIRFYY